MNRTAKWAKRAVWATLAANIQASPLQGTKLVEVSGIKVGIAGVSVPLVAGAPPAGVSASALADVTTDPHAVPLRSPAPTRMGRSSRRYPPVP